MSKSKTGKIALLFESLNNYHLFEEIFFKHTTVDFSNYHIFNIDLNSNPKQKELSREVIEKYDLTEIEVDGNDPHLYSASRCFELCDEYIEANELDIDWILWFQHDCHLIGDDFLQRLEKKLEENPRFAEEVGTIGFKDYNTVKVGSPICGRGGLMREAMASPHRGWYENLPPEYYEADHFVVECPQDNGVLFNRHLWKQHIIPDYNFKLFLWVPDVCHQFGLKGIPSITIPSLEMADLYRLKPQFGVSRSTDCNTAFHKDNFKKQPWLPYWLKKYGWKPNNRDHFGSMKSRFPGSIQEIIFEWAISEGPRSLDDLDMYLGSKAAREE